MFFSSLTGTSINHATRVETNPSEVSVVVGESVVGNYFPLLGLRPSLGRLIGPEDAKSSVAV